VFFTNFSFEGEIIWSHVKEIDIEITLVVWNAITGLKCEGIHVGKGTLVL